MEILPDGIHAASVALLEDTSATPPQQLARPAVISQMSLANAEQISRSQIKLETKSITGELESSEADTCRSMSTGHNQTPKFLAPSYSSAFLHSLSLPLLPFASNPARASLRTCPSIERTDSLSTPLVWNGFDRLR